MIRQKKVKTGDIMAKYTVVDNNPESKSEKRVRYFLAFLYFLQVLLTTIPFMQGEVEDGKYGTITPLQMLIQTDGYHSAKEVYLAIIGGLLIILPIVAFFFCLLDGKSAIKYIFSAASVVITSVIITFIIGRMISIGALIFLVINLVCLFMTMQGFQATRARRAQAKD